MASNTLSNRFDVIIVGARVAGSPLATVLARRGVKVAVLEQAKFPQPTLSSHVIQADSLAFLNRLGVLDEIRATGAPFMSRTDTRLADFRMVQEFPLRAGDVGAVACIRRHVLDPILCDAAVAAGASVRMQAKVTGLIEDRGRVSGVRVSGIDEASELRARLVVGADGRRSTVAADRGARQYNVTTNERWYYWLYFSDADLSGPPTFVFHRWGDRHIFAAPTDNGLYLVGVSPEHDERDKFREDLKGSVMRHVMSCEPVAEIVDKANVASKIHGIVHFNGYFREPSGPGWVLIGDAGHFKDPAAGRGIGDAFKQVDTIAPEIIAGLRETSESLDARLARWGRWRDRAYADYYWLAADLGRRGPVPAVIPAIVERLHERGNDAPFLDLFSHRTSPLDVITPFRMLVGMGQLARGANRRADLRDVATMVSEQTRRAWLRRRPGFADPEPARGHGSGHGHNSSGQSRWNGQGESAS